MKKIFLLVVISCISVTFFSNVTYSKSKSEKKLVAIAQVEGMLDKPNQELIIETINEAHKMKAKLALLQIDVSNIAKFNFDLINKKIENSSVPVVIWFGPKDKTDNYNRIKEIAKKVSFYGFATNKKSSNRRIVNSPTLRGFLIALEGKNIHGQHLNTSIKIKDSGKIKNQVGVSPIFYNLTVSQQVRHAFIRPWIVLFMIAIGFLLILFEYYSASIGLAGVVGAVCLFGGIYGASQLDVNKYFILFCLGVLLIVFDVQAGGLGFWSVISTIMFIVGGKLFVESSLQVSWLVLILIWIGFIVFVGGAIPSMMRTRFGTATIGRENLIGKSGEVIENVSPYGKVKIEGALWKARTNHATPIIIGEEFKVSSIEGIELIIDPIVGAAKDYRK